MVSSGTYGAETLGEAFFYGGQALEDGQFEVGFGGSAFKFGEGTSFMVMNPSEVYSTEVRSQDQPRLGRPGTVAGYDLYGQRQIVLQAMIRGSSVADLQRKIERWKRAFAPVQSGAVPLRWKIKGVTNRYLVFGRPRRTAINEATMGARYVRVAQEFVCHDPRIYEDVLQEKTVGKLPVGGSFLAKRDPHVYIPSDNQEYLYTPRPAASGTITGLDVSIKLAMRTWVPGPGLYVLSHSTADHPSTNKRMWEIYIDGSDYIHLYTHYSSAGGTATDYQSTVTLPNAVTDADKSDYAVRWLRVKLTGAGTSSATATFYYSASSSNTAPADGDASWVQLGSSVTNTTNTGILSSQVADLVAGGLKYYNGNVWYVPHMRVYGVYVNEIGGSGVIANMAVNSDGTFTDTVSANSWTIVNGGTGLRRAEFRDWSLTQPWDAKDTIDVAGSVEPIFTVTGNKDVTVSWDDSAGAVFPGASGTCAKTNDSAVFNLGSAFDLRIKLTAKWNSSTAALPLFGKWDNSSQYSFLMQYNTNHALQLLVSANGTSYTSYNTNIVLTGVADDTVLWLRVVWSGDTGKGYSQAVFYTSSDDGMTWVQFGKTIVSATVLTMFDSTAAVTIGSGLTSGVPISTTYVGIVYRAELFDGNGVLVTNPDFGLQTTGTTSFVDSAGLTWSMVGSAVIAGTPYGSVESPLAVQFTGPMKNPRLKDNVTGATLQFNDLELSKNWNETVLVRDEFTAANATPLSGTTPTYVNSKLIPSGITWTVKNSTWDVYDNAARSATTTASKNNFLYVAPSTGIGANNGYVEARCSIPGGATGLLFRYYNGDNSGYVLYTEFTYALNLYSVTADTGSWTLVKSVEQASWRYGSVVRVEYVDENIRVYVDGELVMTYVDTVRNLSTNYRGAGLATWPVDSSTPRGYRWDSFVMGVIDVPTKPDEVVLDCSEHSAYQNGTKNVRSNMVANGDWPMARQGYKSFTFSSDSTTNKADDVPVRFWYRKAWM